MSISGKHLLSRTAKALEQFRQTAAQKRAAVAAAYRQDGDTERQAVERFRDKVVIETIHTPDHPAFNEVYDVYLKNFPIKSEQESKEGFLEVLGYNDDPAIQSKYGPFEESWVVARDPDTGRVIGGVNFITFHLKQDEQAAKHVDGVQHLTYCFVSPEYRAMGVAGKLMNAAEDHSRQFLMNHTPDCCDPSHLRMPTFNEQNQPMAMSLYDYFFDTMNAGIDQYDRLAYWNKRGFRKLDHSYVQPPLEAGEEACRGLSLYVKTDPQMHHMPSSVVEAYLYRYFSTTVLKNTPTDNDPDWIAQKRELSEKPSIPLVSPSANDNQKNEVWQHLAVQTQAKRGRYHQPLGEVDLPQPAHKAPPKPLPLQNHRALRF